MPPHFHAGAIRFLRMCQTFVAPGAHLECESMQFWQDVAFMAAVMLLVCRMLLSTSNCSTRSCDNGFLQRSMFMTALM